MKKLQFTGCFKYGSNILSEFASHADCYGKSFAFIGGKRAIAAVREPVSKSLEGNGCSHSWIECSGPATLSEIDRLMELPEVKEADVVCGVGGGSAMDIARTAGNRLGKALIMVPTTAAADAACSSVSVFYSEDGSQVVGDQVFHKCPDLVIVDAQVIAEAPARHLAAGMGDGLATWYEAKTNYDHEGENSITDTGMMLGQLARELILANGLEAYRSVENKTSTPALEKVIEANVFLSGTGGANTGCAAAHGIGDFLAGVQDCHRFMHGERVYVGLMVQLILEGYPLSEIKQLMWFGKSIGLPLSLEDLGVTDIPETAGEMAKALQNDHFMVNLSCDYSVDVLTKAFITAQQYAREV